MSSCPQEAPRARGHFGHFLKTCCRLQKAAGLCCTLRAGHTLSSVRRGPWKASWPGSREQGVSTVCEFAHCVSYSFFLSICENILHILISKINLFQEFLVFQLMDQIPELYVITSKNDYVLVHGTRSPRLLELSPGKQSLGRVGTDRIADNESLL